MKPERGYAAAYGGACGLLALAAAFFFFRLFPGVAGDAQIYIGRAIADLDPAGVGRDAMFVNDGQSHLSLFTRIAPALVAALGPFGAAILLSLAAMVLWFAALVVFSLRIAPARAWAVALAVAAAPAGYSFLSFGEALPLPRPFGEAFVLFALAAQLDGRRLFAFLLLCAAALFHPIMALAGFALVGLLWAFADRRWLYAALAFAVALAVAAGLGLGPFARLAVVMDDEWLAVVRARNGFLFPQTWPLETWGLQFVQAATLVFAARRSEAPVRNLFLAGLGVGVAGLGLSLVATAWPNMLLVQAQPWRMWWLTAALAAAALGLAATRYRESGARDRLAFVAMVFAWLLAHVAPAEAMAVAAGALVLPPRLSPAPNLARWAFVAVAAYVAATGAFTIVGAAALLRQMGEAGGAPTLREIVGLLFGDMLFLAVLALGMFGAGAIARLPRVGVQAGALSLAAVVAFVWDSAPAYERALYARRGQPALDALLKGRPGEILWLKGRVEAWLWTGRPNWGSEIQGASIVFSRPLAMLYRDRIAAQFESGLGGRELIGRWRAKPETFFPNVTAPGLRALCARADAPAFVIWPVENSAPLAEALKAREWIAPAPRIELANAAADGTFQRIERHAVAACADHR